jgi:hypothetical protein
LRTDFQTAILLHNEYAIKKLFVPKKQKKMKKFFFK